MRSIGSFFIPRRKSEISLFARDLLDCGSLILALLQGSLEGVFWALLVLLVVLHCPGALMHYRRLGQELIRSDAQDNGL